MNSDIFISDLKYFIGKIKNILLNKKFIIFTLWFLGFYLSALYDLAIIYFTITGIKFIFCNLG